MALDKTCGACKWAHASSADVPDRLSPACIPLDDREINKFGFVMIAALCIMI